MISHISILLVSMQCGMKKNKPETCCSNCCAFSPRIREPRKSLKCYTDRANGRLNGGEMGIRVSRKHRARIVTTRLHALCIVTLFALLFVCCPGTAQSMEALAQQSQTKQARPTDIETSLNLIRTDLQTKRTTEALRLAAQLSAENKNNVHLHVSLGVLLASEKQYKPAQLE